MTKPTKEQLSRSQRAYGQPRRKRRRKVWSLTVDQLVRGHAELVHALARRYGRRSGAVADMDDLVSVGITALLDAYRSFDPHGEAPFEAYARVRVRGAMIDELRKLDPLSQGARRAVRQLADAMARLGQRLGREPTDDELAAELSVDLEGLARIRTNEQTRFVPLDKSEADDIRVSLARASTDRATLKIALKEALRELPDRQQTLMSLYYQEDMTLKEIGEIMGITEARVSQLRKAAIAQLRETMEVVLR